MKRILIAFTLVAALLGIGATAVTARQARQAPPSWTHVVAPGETLWGLAREAAPDRDRRETVDRLVKANGLPGGTIRPGQRLVLPRS
jgi:LysM repeat protein